MNKATLLCKYCDKSFHVFSESDVDFLDTILEVVTYGGCKCFSCKDKERAEELRELMRPLDTVLDKLRRFNTIH